MAFDPLPQQCLAIEAPLGPVLVVAGPGAGKTFCLIARINYLIDALHVAPERICAVTFTNRAAEEIAIRLKHTLGERAEPIARGTIHALCLALLREHAEAAGLRKGFGVADEQYQKAILGRLHVPQEQRGSLLNRFKSEPRCSCGDRKSTRLNSSHRCISYAVFCLKKKKKTKIKD